MVKKSDEAQAPEDVTDDNYEDADESYTDEAPMSALPTRNTVSTSGIPARTRKTSTYELWAPIVEELRTTALGEAWSYENVPGVSGVVQGLTKHYGLNAASRNVITKKMVEKGLARDEDIGKGTLWIEYPTLADNGNFVPDEDTVRLNKEKANS